MNSGIRIKYLSASDDFPPPENSLANGLLAAGGDLSPVRLEKAYSSGIFPWYDESTPILWYSPPVRCILRPDAFKTSASLKQKLKKGVFTLSIDRDFGGVIRGCANVKRKSDNGTWIIPAMISAYTTLHEKGLAHSVEVWHENRLAGGLYGVSIGKAFFGESMFHYETDASKAALHYLCKKLEEQKFHFIDAQIPTNHLLSLGAENITRQGYMQLLEKALQAETIRGSWENL